MMLDKQLAALDLRTVPDKTLLSVLHAIQNELVKRNSVRYESQIEAQRFFKRKRKLLSNDQKVDFQTLDREDWSSLFTGGSLERKFYVYAHISKGGKLFPAGSDLLPFGLRRMPFYIGKGCGNRAYDLKRNQGHGALLKGLGEATAAPAPEEAVSIKILRDNLTEDEAFALESKLIYFFGTKYEIGKAGVLVNLDVPKIPDWCVLRRQGITGPRSDR